MAKILDYSLARPPVSEIKARGYSGVMRYLAPVPMDEAKVITAQEYAALRAAGLEIGLNWEWYDVRPKEGASAGEADAAEALKQSNALNYHGPIYFSVDFDAAPGDQVAINAYFEACARVLGKARLGCYGGYWPLSRLFNANLISFGWQACAWSGNNREARAHLFQTGATDFNEGADINDVLKADWNSVAQPAPPAPPVTATLAEWQAYGAAIEKWLLAAPKPPL